MIESAFSNRRPGNGQLGCPLPSAILLTFAVLVSWLGLAVCDSADASDAADGFFDREIAPILAEQCLSCHSGSDPEGELNLQSSPDAKVTRDSGRLLQPGKPAESLLWQRIESDEMPPDSPLSDEAKERIRNWIVAGAKWGSKPIDPFQLSSESRAGYDWWSLQPIQRPVVPIEIRAANPIDCFVVRRLKENQLSPSPRASAHEIARRVHFDLVGMPPTPEVVLEFQKEFKVDSTRAVERLVDRLLASPRFGERWARHWLDVARFGESQGFERDRLRDNSWPYRDWVINAINEDMPYDRFVRLQLAGDVLEPQDAESVIATGFLVAGAWDEVGQKQQSAAMKAVVRQDEMEDYVGTIGQAFLGLTINCARCHDHKFDPITQKEYYQISAALAGVHHGSREVVRVDKQTQSEKQTPQQKQNVYAVKPGKPEQTFVLARGNPAQRRDAVDPGGIRALNPRSRAFGILSDGSDAERRKELSNWIVSRENPLFARVIVNRLWHYHFGTGIVDTPNDFGFGGGAPSHPELLDYLASELIESGYRLKHIHRLILCSDTYLQSSRYRADCAKVDAENRLLWRKATTRLDAESIRDSVLAISGQFNGQVGGPSYQDFKTHIHNSQFYEMVDLDSPDVYRRTIYRTWIRSGRSHLLDVFDCPDPSTTAPKRSVTTTPLQALSLMNNSFIMRMSERFASRVAFEVGTDPRDQVDRVYHLAFGRLPDSTERELTAAFVRSHGLAALARVVFNSNEFIHVD